MFKKTMIVVGAIVAASMSMPGVASAAPHRLSRIHGVRFTPRTLRQAQALPLRAHFSSRRPRRGRFAVARRGFRVAERVRFSVRHHAYGLRHVAFRARRPFAPRYVAAPIVAAPETSGVQVGRASFYGGGGRTAAGGHVGAATCAHRSLPFGTRVLVTNLANARRAVLTVNDRGPFVGGRIVDVSVGAAGMLGMLHSGTAPVSVQVVGGRG